MDASTAALIGSGIGFFAGVVGAWGGAVIASRAQRTSQREDRAAQRNAQREERKARAYEEALRHLWHRQVQLGRLMSKAPAVDDLVRAVEHPDMMEPWTITALHGSEPVLEKLRAVNGAESKWVARVWDISEQDAPDPGGDDELRQIVGYTLPSAIHALEEAMNRDLHPSSSTEDSTS